MASNENAKTWPVWGEPEAEAAEKWVLAAVPDLAAPVDRQSGPDEAAGGLLCW